MTKNLGSPPWFLWPFVMVWRLVVGIIKVVGRFVAAAIGLVLVVVGIILCLTIVGAIIGIPLIMFGLLLMVRSLF